MALVVNVGGKGSPEMSRETRGLLPLEQLGVAHDRPGGTIP